MGRPSDHRVHQSQHLAARTGTTDPADQAHRDVHQRFQAEALRQCRDEQQASVADQVRVVEGDVDPVNPVRYSRH